jgi:serine/threonine-protein kinase RIO1
MENVFFLFFFRFFLDEIRKFISKGNCADVYKCILKDTNTEMAIKVFNSTKDGKPISCDITINDLS